MLLLLNFFFGKLLSSFLSNPGKGALINNFIISEKTKNNLIVIGNINNKMTSNEFYNKNTESDYTPFNWYFIEKMEDLFNIFDNITKVKLPSLLKN